jgi:Tfp pilus assembly protein PilF
LRRSAPAAFIVAHHVERFAAHFFFRPPPRPRLPHARDATRTRRATSDPSAVKATRAAPLPARPRWLGAALLVLAIMLAYAPVRHAGFIWDDDLHLTANPSVLGGAEGLAKIWTSPAANYFPLTMTSFWALHALVGLAPLPYHVVTLLLHTGAALLLWAVLRRLRVPGAGLGAALWALHPVQVESVAWISELKNTQSAVFFLAAIWFYLGAHQAASPRRDYALALLCGAGAMLSKSSTVMLPAVLALCEWWRKTLPPSALRRPGGGAWRLAPFLVLSLAASAWTVWEQKVSSGAQGADWSHGLAARVALAGRVVWFYLGKLAWPEPLTFIYPRWSTEVASLPAWLPLLALLAASLALAGYARRFATLRAMWFAALAFGALLFPVLGLFDVYFFRFSFVGDHLQYLASMAPLALLGAAVARGAGRRPHLAAAALLLAGGALTFRQARIYRDDRTLFADTVAKNPAAWMAHNNLSLALLDVGEAEAAIAHARRALELRADYAEAENNLGRALLLAGRPAEAVANFERAHTLDPRDAEAPNNLGAALASLGRHAEARASLETALRLQPTHAGALYNYGLVLGREGDFAGAREKFSAAIAARPDYAEAHANLGLALAALGRIDEAVPALERALQLAPQSAANLATYGRALAIAGRLEQAAARYEQALALDPTLPEARATLAAIRQQLGRPGAAPAPPPR